MHDEKQAITPADLELTPVELVALETRASVQRAKERAAKRRNRALRYNARSIKVIQSEFRKLLRKQDAWSKDEKARFHILLESLYRRAIKGDLKATELMFSCAFGKPLRR